MVGARCHRDTCRMVPVAETLPGQVGVILGLTEIGIEIGGVWMG